MRPELMAALIAVSGVALLVAGWREEADALARVKAEKVKTERGQEDDDAEALPAEDL